MLRFVRRALAVAAFAFVVAPAAQADPGLTATATPAVGAAPLNVTLTASGDDAAFHWVLGDGTFADGATVHHVYAAGAFTATVTATRPDGTTAQATTAIRAVAVALTVPSSARYGRTAVFAGTVVPATADEEVALLAAGRRVSRATTGGGGRFRIKLKLVSPGPYQAVVADAASAPTLVRLRPVLTAAFDGPATIGRPLAAVARLRPAAAGSVVARVYRNGRLVQTRRIGPRGRVRLATRDSVRYRVVAATVPAPGWLATRTAIETVVVQPNLTFGATGASVRALEERLAAMHYALRAVDGAFGEDTFEAVLAFQKVHGLARTGRVDAEVWRRIETSPSPQARYRGDHVEIDKSRQVLFEVRKGKVVLVAHVSTGATGNTPPGVWHIYRRVVGWDWVLYFPTYFTGAFAIHGYPSVPAYPASHGCVRVPLWLAPRLFAMNFPGEAVYIYA